MPTTYRAAAQMALLSKRRLAASSSAHMPPPPPSPSSPSSSLPSRPLRSQESHYYMAANAASQQHNKTEIKSAAQRQPLSLCAATGRSGGRMLWFVRASVQCLLLLQFVASSASTKDGEQLAQCCTKMLPNSAKSAAVEFCRGALALNAADQAELSSAFGCVADASITAMEKRKPNFMRYGRSPFGSSADPNFLRFGRASVTAATDPLRDLLAAAEKKSNGVSANFLRFGKSASDPNFLRFGKRASALSSPLLGSDSAEPNFLRFGKRAPISTFYGGDDIMAEKFDREYRKPNFLRFG